MLSKELTFLKTTTTRDYSVPAQPISQHFILHLLSPITHPDFICMHLPWQHGRSHITHTCNQVFNIPGQRHQTQNCNFQPTDTLQHIHGTLLFDIAIVIAHTTVHFLHYGNETVVPSSDKYFSSIQASYVRLLFIKVTHTFFLVEGLKYNSQGINYGNWWSAKMKLGE
jgi:hypothetical protein